ncbi:hypothetical protein K461DRAFT_279990 [Myriangium duriaei CBS 260.36]|uniref:Bacteriophage T5 Orf172 DNA-binding domain-containing protein n=1 Tax=Myriangium duriaei CBS 260.36 TaxID=1168546 RepID=A0A9P4J0H0_9PEZI|nr:hypothetical protein K461DRAFT_279990 [Myriangium duriaei CBS 260.36]
MPVNVQKIKPAHGRTDSMSPSMKEKSDIDTSASRKPGTEQPRAAASDKSKSALSTPTRIYTPLSLDDGTHSDNETTSDCAEHSEYEAPSESEGTSDIETPRKIRSKHKRISINRLAESTKGLRLSFTLADDTPVEDTPSRCTSSTKPSSKSTSNKVTPSSAPRWQWRPLNDDDDFLSPMRGSPSSVSSDKSGSKTRKQVTTPTLARRALLQDSDLDSTHERRASAPPALTPSKLKGSPIPHIRRAISDSATAPLRVLLDREQMNKVMEYLPDPTTMKMSAAILQVMSNPKFYEMKEGSIYVYTITDWDEKPDVTTKYLDDHHPSKTGLFGGDGPKTSVKIGRSIKDVQARMKLFNKECKIVPTVVLCYPRMMDNATRSPRWKKLHRTLHSEVSMLPLNATGSSELLKTVPYPKLVEGLIHTQLEELQVDVPCECGTNHREWFKIENTLDALKHVDKVVRNWIRWAEEWAEEYAKKLNLEVKSS